jgi:sugar O-acyltransferase (sialic acid O-acetyltransferase NeuD family)
LKVSGENIESIGFLVDDEFKEESVVHDLPVFGDAAWLRDRDDVAVTIAIGATAPRHRIARRIESESGSSFPLLKHPRAWVGERVKIGAGSIVCANSSVTSDISVGKHVQLHVGCTIGHDTTAEDFVTVAPGANVSGRVRIGEGVFIGAGAVILPDIEIGAWTTVGAGAVVTKNLPNNVVAVGVPARVIRERPSGWQCHSNA